MIYKKLKRTFSNGYASFIPNFEKVFPELSKIDRMELCHRLKELNIEFFYEENTTVNFWIRLTLPFAIFTMFLMLIYLPINFIITGKWYYEIGKKIKILNWFKALRLVA